MVSPTTFIHARTLTGHTSYVGPLVNVPPDCVEELPSGALASGSMDATVRIWDVASGECLYVCPGHTYQVQ
jgi:WD40 repeat protein